MSFEHPRVLIADTDKNSVSLLRQILSEQGYETFVCENGQEAINRFDSLYPEIVISDWALPDMAGTEILRQIRANKVNKYCYFMFLTARGLRENIIKGINAGADDYMVKPFYAEELKARVRAGARLVTLQKQLIERNTMLEEFVYTVTHDLRTPLIALQLTNKQAADGVFGEMPKPYVQVLDITKRSIADLLSMVDNLLQVAKYESGEQGKKKGEPLPRTEMVLLCRECIGEFHPIYSRKNLDVKLLSNISEVWVNVERQDLKRVILNLLDNAIKFTPSGGVIRLSIELAAQKVIVGVQDSGHGIKKEEAKLIFERFARAKSSRHAPGTGLGLYLCRRIVEAHSGAVDCIGRPGGGTTFSFMLPVAGSQSK
jgi:signal transduction histidine kinase